MNLNQDVTAPVPIERPREQPGSVIQVGVVLPILKALIWGGGVAFLVLLVVLILREVARDVRLSWREFGYLWAALAAYSALVASRQPGGIAPALATGLLVGFVVASGFLLLYYLATLNLSATAYLLLVLLVLVVVSLIAWHKYEPEAHWLVERMFGQDFNLDGYIGEPPQQISRHEIVIPQENRAVYLDLPISNKEMARIAQALLEGQVNVSVNGLKAYTPHAAALVAQLEARGMAVRKSPLQPGELTVWGKHWLKSVVTEAGS